MDRHSDKPLLMRRRVGFTLIELLVVIAIIAVLTGILLPALSGAFRSARLLKCQANMRSMGTAAMGYGLDNREIIPAYNWKPGNADIKYDDMRSEVTNDERRTVQLQAVSIIRDVIGNRFVSKDSGGNNWNAHMWFTHMVFFDYLSGNPEEPAAACPNDEEQIERAERPTTDYGTDEVFRKFESSYETSPVTYSVDTERNGLRPLSQHNKHYRLIDRLSRYLATRRFTDVAFASGKVYMFDTYDRHFAELPDTIYFEPDAKQPLLFFDGSVSVRATRDANPGFRPRDPTNPEPSLLFKSFSNSDEKYPGYYRWTRGGLRGIDYGDNEIGVRQTVP